MAYLNHTLSRTLGKKFRCDRCGFAYRENEMIVQRGYLVCTETCVDAPAYEGPLKP